MNIEVFNETDVNYKKELKDIKNILKFLVNYFNVSKSFVNVVLITDNEIKRINNEYRNINKSTDVISFALEESCVKSNEKILGDIFY